MAIKTRAALAYFLRWKKITKNSTPLPDTSSGDYEFIGGINR